MVKRNSNPGQGDQEANAQPTQPSHCNRFSNIWQSSAIWQPGSCHIIIEFIVDSFYSYHRLKIYSQMVCIVPCNEHPKELFLETCYQVFETYTKGPSLVWLVATLYRRFPSFRDRSKIRIYQPICKSTVAAN